MNVTPTEHAIQNGWCNLKKHHKNAGGKTLHQPRFLKFSEILAEFTDTEQPKNSVMAQPAGTRTRRHWRAPQREPVAWGLRDYECVH